MTLALYCVGVAFASFIGGVLPQLMKLTPLRLYLMIALIGGLMVGVAFLHQVPHAVVAISDWQPKGALTLTMMSVTAGVVLMFLLLHAFGSHAHAVPDGEDAAGHSHDHGHSHYSSHSHDHSENHAHGHDCGHDHSHAAPASAPLHASGMGLEIVHHATTHPTVPAAAHTYSWLGVAIGLVLHTLVDGIALAASVKADYAHHPDSVIPGIGTFLAIALHKPLDALAITSLMLAAGWSFKSRMVVNALYATTCPLGVMLFITGLDTVSTAQALVVGVALAFSAGVFATIALSDLLPEVPFRGKHRLILTAALIAGVVAAWGIGFLEPEHAHDVSGGHGQHGHSH